MPALITHNAFGQDVLYDLRELIGNDHASRQAFLLGNQGPDPLFFAVIDPIAHPHSQLGTTMHAERPSELLVAFRRSVEVLPPEEHAIARAYFYGFLCHYLLDSSMHPFIYTQEYALCDAGVDDLSRADGFEVHALIESELDEMVLYVKRGVTIATFSPADEVLDASDYVCSIISKMYAYAAMTVYGNFLPADTYLKAVKANRFAQKAFHSPTGQKRIVLSNIERLFRSHSFVQAASMRAIEMTTSQFDNRMRSTWANPFTDEVRSDSFWDIFDDTTKRAKGIIASIAKGPLTLEAARAITNELDFSGRPTCATIVVEEG